MQNDKAIVRDRRMKRSAHIAERVIALTCLAVLAWVLIGLPQ